MGSSNGVLYTLQWVPSSDGTKGGSLQLVDRFGGEGPIMSNLVASQAGYVYAATASIATQPGTAVSAIYRLNTDGVRTWRGTVPSNVSHVTALSIDDACDRLYVSGDDSVIYAISMSGSVVAWSYAAPGGPGASAVAPDPDSCDVIYYGSADGGVVALWVGEGPVPTKSATPTASPSPSSSPLSPSRSPSVSPSSSPSPSSTGGGGGGIPQPDSGADLDVDVGQAIGFSALGSALAVSACIVVSRYRMRGGGGSGGGRKKNGGGRKGGNGDSLSYGLLADDAAGGAYSRGSSLTEPDMEQALAQSEGHVAAAPAEGGANDGGGDDDGSSIENEDSDDEDAYLFPTVVKPAAPAAAAVPFTPAPLERSASSFSVTASGSPSSRRPTIIRYSIPNVASGAGGGAK